MALTLELMMSVSRENTPMILSFPGLTCRPRVEKQSPCQGRAMFQPLDFLTKNVAKKISPVAKVA
jgi:hypothetical protein